MNAKKKQLIVAQPERYSTHLSSSICSFLRSNCFTEAICARNIDKCIYYIIKKDKTNQVLHIKRFYSVLLLRDFRRCFARDNTCHHFFSNTPATVVLIGAYFMHEKDMCAKLVLCIILTYILHFITIDHGYYL